MKKESGVIRVFRNRFSAGKGKTNGRSKMICPHLKSVLVICYPIRERDNREKCICYK